MLRFPGFKNHKHDHNFDKGTREKCSVQAKLSEGGAALTVWQTIWLDSGQVRRLLADLPSVLDLDAGQGHARASGPRLANVSENEKDVPCAITKAYKGESLG